MLFLSCLAGCFTNQATKPPNEKPINERADLSPTEPTQPNAISTGSDGDRSTRSDILPPGSFTRSTPSRPSDPQESQHAPSTRDILSNAQSLRFEGPVSVTIKPPDEKPIRCRGGDPARIEPTQSNAVSGEGGRPVNNALLDPQHTVPSSPGILSHAQNVRFDGPVIINEHTVQMESKPSANATEAIEKLRLRTDPNAAVDSSARQPPPTCHPKTRREIRNKLTNLFNDLDREFLMAWLFGAAGTGKSAVGQTFAMICREKHRLGAAFFFSRPNGRNRYEAVVPTLAYQLAVHCPVYRPALITRIEYDPQIFDKSPPIQLEWLIVRPLLEVRSQITTTYLMLLDGVDECGANPTDVHEREREQCELVKMIADTVRAHPDLPLFWLLCSRPEQHLQKAFADITMMCQREELVIDAKCREEVETVLREGFAKIAKERDVIPPGPDGWPSKSEFDTVERAVSGLHVFGAAILRDIEHSDAPLQQLESLIPFLERVAISGTARSIEAMDSFYFRILNEVPEDRLPTTLKIIGALITMPDPHDLSAQSLCNFLRLDPNDFFSALRKVHSVIDVPPLKTTHIMALLLYHASFSDFLTDSKRSGKFFINKKKALVDVIKHCFFWHRLHSNLFHSSDQPFVVRPEHDHDPLPRIHFKWIISSSNHKAISRQICKYAEDHCFSIFSRHPRNRDAELLSLFCDPSLTHMSSSSHIGVIEFIRWLYNQDPFSGFIRTEPENDEDRKLLTYLKAVAGNVVVPAALPPTWGIGSPALREYLFIGRNSQSIIVWITKVSSSSHTLCIMALNQNREPDEHTFAVHEEMLGTLVPR